MIDLVDSVKLAGVRKALKKGRLLDFASADQALRILAKDHEMESRFRAMASDAFSARIKSGKRLTGDQFAALKLFDQQLAAQYEADRPMRSHAVSTADRVAAHVARRSDIGQIPQIVDQGRREDCRLNLELFGVTYCGLLLKHAPSSNMRPFIRNMQDAILLGGRVHVRWPRGKGKSTWIKIGILWATLYGHRRFAVCFAASGRNAKAILADIWKAMDRSETMFEDFPEVCYPVRCIKGVVQRCTTQTYNGQQTGICKTSDMLTLPKIEGSVAGGAMIVCRGVEAGTRGLVDMDQRPDFLFFDDIQTKKSAGSKSKTDWLEEFIAQDAMCMGGHDSSIAALMASTPIRPNDLSERFADAEQHAEWITYTTPLVMRWPTDMDLVEEFGKMYRKDLANRDLGMTLSTAFYRENQEAIEAGSEVLDPLDGDPQTEVSALHHALILFYYVGRDGFNAEYQMQTRRQHEVFSLEVDTVCRAVNFYDRCVVPDECRNVVGFCDVNASADAGLRWGLLAVGAGRVCGVIAYGRYPETGRLYPEKSTPTKMRLAIANGIASVVSKIEALPIRRTSGQRVRIHAICFDSGWETKVVARTIKTLRAPFHLIISKGFGWKNYRPFKQGGEQRDGVTAVGDHFHISESENGAFLCVHADYWREEAQRSLLARPLSPGSISFYGRDTTEHYDFAGEICAEKLVDKGIGLNGTEMWVWNKTSVNHWGDVLTGCLATAALYRFYDATEDLVSREMAGVNAISGRASVFNRITHRQAYANRFKTRFTIKRK